MLVVREPDLTVAVEFEGVSKAFGDVRAVNEVDLAIHDGEFFAMLGPSGSGKTSLRTTLNAYFGLRRFTSDGTVHAAPLGMVVQPFPGRSLLSRTRREPEGA